MAIITKVENISGVIIPELNNLGVGEKRVIYYNRPFFLLHTIIGEQLFAGRIQFIDDENLVVCQRNPNYQSVVDEQFTNPQLLNSMYQKFIRNWNPDEEAKASLEEEAGRGILYAIRALRVKQTTKVNPIIYPKSALRLSLTGITEHLQNGELDEAATKLALIPNDAFWTNARRNRFIDLCNSVSL